MKLFKIIKTAILDILKENVIFDTLIIVEKNITFVHSFLWTINKLGNVFIISSVHK